MKGGGFPAPVRFHDVAGFVLAGGRSSRMGQDKALLRLGLRPLIEWGLDILREAGVEAWIAGARNPDLAVFAPVIADEWEDLGPLGGVCSALRQTHREWGIFLTVDQPLVARWLVLRLIQRAREGNAAVTVASLGAEAQTFPAVVRRDALTVLERELKAGRLGCLSAFCTAGLQTIAVEDGASPEDYPLLRRWFWNVNTPADLESIRETLGIR